MQTAPTTQVTAERKVKLSSLAAFRLCAELAAPPLAQWESQHKLSNKNAGTSERHTRHRQHCKHAAVQHLCNIQDAGRTSLFCSMACSGSGVHGCGPASDAAERARCKSTPRQVARPRTRLETSATGVRHVAAQRRPATTRSAPRRDAVGPTPPKSNRAAATSVDVERCNIARFHATAAGGTGPEIAQPDATQAVRRGEISTHPARGASPPSPDSARGRLPAPEPPPRSRAANAGELRDASTTPHPNARQAPNGADSPAARRELVMQRTAYYTACRSAHSPAASAAAAPRLVVEELSRT